jgi:acyl carrier protein
MIDRSQLRAFVSDLLARRGDAAPLADGDALVSSGRLESIDVIEVVAFLEDRFGVDFAERGIRAEDFESIDAITELAPASEAA